MGRWGDGEQKLGMIDDSEVSDYDLNPSSHSSNGLSVILNIIDDLFGVLARSQLVI
jgi:hypothetical protein